MNTKPRRILFVDDDSNFLDGIERALHAQREVWELVFARNFEEVLPTIGTDRLDAVVTDVRMPGKDGFKVLQAIHESEGLRDVPVILLTGHGDSELRVLALGMGAYDLLTKPVEKEELIARIRSALHLKAVQDELKEANAGLERKVAERTAEIEWSRLEIIWRLAKAVERRDGCSGNHIVRVGCYARLIGESLGMLVEPLKLLFLTAPLHDLGKIVVSDAILLKPGALTAEEQQIMQGHCRAGADMLLQEAVTAKPYLEWLGREGDATPESAPWGRLLTTAAAIALTHHEHWDGSGYPKGLSGTDIPLEGRIVAVADVYDALGSDRPDRKALSEEAARTAVLAESAKHFDPAVVDAFDRAFSRVCEVRSQFSDEVLVPV